MTDRGRSALLVAAQLVVAGCLVLVGAIVFGAPWMPPPRQGRVAQFEIGPADDVGTVARRLAEAGIVRWPAAFAAWARLMGAETRLRRGRIEVTDAMVPRRVLRAIAEGYGPAPRRFTIPEGFTRFQIADRLDALGIVDRQALLAATEDPMLRETYGIPGSSVEGYLFPDTYDSQEGANATRIVRRMVAAHARRMGRLLEMYPRQLARLRAAGIDVHGVVTLASIVEKEAAVAHERPRIAGVFLNRLLSASFRPRRLQADPTVSYGCLAHPNVSAACRAFDGRRITRAMLDDAANPYNTYRHEGLPPGPIANPGLASLRAVLDPETHGWFYFVARGDGTHVFSATLEEHEAAVRAYQGASPARGNGEDQTAIAPATVVPSH
ncbi:MAG: endolytic transglycosylase MltG [Myxococcota bacterium]|nr:endolytic transglycosylase MltG [Myxococcota bacterium]MDW8362192.1 endolytic transglycosylase MltG [Myxococcales bacterium]